MSIDAAAIQRRIKPHKRRTQLSARLPAELVSASDLGEGIPSLLFDTNVYIKDAAGTLPGDAESVVDRCNSFHCSVCVGELMTGIGNADPALSAWVSQRNHILGLVASIPDHKLLTPDEDVWAEAGLIAGTLARVQNFHADSGEAGHLFRHQACQRSDLKPATWGGCAGRSFSFPDRC